MSKYNDEDLALFRLLTSGWSDAPAATPATQASSTTASGALSQVLPYLSSSTTSHTSSPSTDTQQPSGSWSSLGLPSALATGAGALTKIAGAYAGLPSLVTSPMSALVKSYLGDSTESSMKRSVGDAAINSALSLAIPGIGLPMSLMGMLGFSPTRGLQNLLNPNTEVPASWRGGFFDKGYEPPTGSYMESGNAQYSPYGGLSKVEQIALNSGTAQTSTGSQGPNTGVGSGFNSASWGNYSDSDSSSSSDD